MDTGSSTCFLADVVAVGFGSATAPRGEVMTAVYFRANLPAEWRPDYERLLKAAQEFALARSRDIKPVILPGLARRQQRRAWRRRPPGSLPGNRSSFQNTDQPPDPHPQAH